MKNLLSKTTKNFAAKRDMHVSLVDLDDSALHLTIVDEATADECDAELSFKQDDKGGFYFFSNTYLPQQVKEEIPAYIRDEKHLREVVEYLATEVETIREELF